MAQKSLFHFGIGNSNEQNRKSDSDNGSTNRTPTKRKQSDCDSEPNSKRACSESATPKSRLKRKFRSEWLNEFKWLEVSQNDDQTIMYCTWCKNAKKKNPFANGGSSNLQKSALDRHGNSNPEHLEVVRAHELVKSKQTVKDVIEIKENTQSLENVQSKEAQLKTMYFVAKNNLPLRIHNELINLQAENGCKSLQDRSTIYTSSGVHEDMIDAINSELAESVSKDINYSDFVGLIVDETTDITIHKKLNIYFKCFKADTCEPVVHFVDCVSVVNGKAETLVNEIEKACASMGLDLMKVVSMASDGASVMTGRKGGVGALLRKKNHRLVQIHCVAHRLALCAGQACRDVTSFNDFHDTVKMIYRFFHNSAVRYNSLREIETVLNDVNGDTKHVTLKEPASTRWLSLECAVKAIYNSYPAVVIALENEAANGVSEAKGLLKRVKNVSFLLKTAFLVDVLFSVNKLCKVFQKDELDIDTVSINIKSTTETLEAYKITNGPTLRTVYGEIADGKYKDVKLNDTPQLRIAFQSSADSYIKTIVDNISSRFDETSMDKLAVANRVLNPKLIPISTVAICDYGINDLDAIIDWLGPLGNIPGLVEPERMKADHLQFKMTLKNLRGKSLKTVCQYVIEHYSETFPDYCVLAKYTLTAPLTSVACERGFSTQNRLKTKARPGMTHDKVAKLIRIIEEGPTVGDFPTQKIVRRFDQMCKRRK